jgi:peptidoglycan/xylan/chitin deacetylase (PgdA/CDA1 family)
MPRMANLSRSAAHRAWLGGWAAKDAVAGVSRRRSDGAVALTFDDGPHPDSTVRVLDTLAELQVQATFFCVGKNARAHPDIIGRALREGHSIGSHSLTHPHPAALSLAARSAEYREGRRAVTEAAGRDIRLFRPPHGHVTLATGAVMRRQRLSPWLWTVDPEDWRPGATTSEVASVGAAAASGDVILLHDWVEEPWAPQALDRSSTIEALPTIVREVRRRGLRFATLPM